MNAMAGQKRSFMNELLERTTCSRTSLRECNESLNLLVDDLCINYYPTMADNPKKLLDMLLLDTCFVLEVLLTFRDMSDRRVKKIQPSDRLRKEQEMLVTNSLLRRDLALLENQLPFMLLENVFGIIQRNSATPMEHLSLPQITFDFFQSDFSCPFNPSHDGKYDHMLHLVSRCFNPPEPEAEQTPSDTKAVIELLPVVRRATKLKEAGVVFVAARGRALLDLRFGAGGKFQIPPLLINECTESLLRQLMAYEHAAAEDPMEGKGHLASYIFLMERLVGQSEDFDLLESKGILINQMGGRGDAYQIFNRISRQFSLKKFFFSKLCTDVERHCDANKTQYYHELKTQYLKSPWTTISLVGAGVLLILTFIKTVYTVLGYYSHP